MTEKNSVKMELMNLGSKFIVPESSQKLSNLVQ